MTEKTNEELIPPVAEGDIIEDQEVINLGKRGEGVVKYEGYILFVPNCEKGDIINIKVEKVMPKFGTGIKIEGETDDN